MVQESIQFVLLVIVGTTWVMFQAEGSCYWPEYFDVSKKYWEYADEEKSWETASKVETDIFSEINGIIKSRQLITIMNNDTMEMSYHKDMQTVWSEKYKCMKGFGNEVYLIKRTDVVMNLLPGDIVINKIDTSVKYRCMQLYKRSRFVVQWRLGALYDDHHECQGNSGELKPTPLVYFPVRYTRRDEKIFEYTKLLEEYQSCPKIGGYLMKVYEANGSHVESHDCANEEPSPRFEMECTPGEGLQISPSREPCPRYSFAMKAGSKLYCLASWEDGQHSFTVLVPADRQIHSFHCLRMNKNDPASEKAILFLDNICKLGDPDPDKEAFFQLILRRKEVSSKCDDYSDHCNYPGRNCDDIIQKAACMSTCGACPSDSPEGISLDQSLRGQWIIQHEDREDIVYIHDEVISLPKLGNFDVHGNPNISACNRVRNIFYDGFKYVLSTSDTKRGCTHRVIQLTFKKISASVALLHFTNPSAIRYNEFALNASNWCGNNKLEVDFNSQLFRPYWPYTTRPGSSLTRDGWYTMVNSAIQESVPCGISGYKIGYAAHILTRATVNLQGNQKYNCRGEVRTNGTNTVTLSLDNCDNNVQHSEMVFNCLANYKMSSDYQALTLQMSNGTSDTLLNNANFYCLLLPKYGERKRLFIIFHPAGICDYPFQYFVHQNHKEPLVKMLFIHSLVGHSNINQSLLCLIFTSFLFAVFAIFT